MCGRFTLHLTPELLGSIFGVKTSLQLTPRYNISPTQTVPVVRETRGGGRSLSELSWGLVPSWAKDPSFGQKLINARSETAHEKPSFRHALRKQRCIIPASGFFEWSHIDGSKQPWYVTLKDSAPMGFAGLWESWQAPDGGALETFCILTTAANSLIATIHERMPVILQAADYSSWLCPEQNTPENLDRYFQPCPADILTLFKVSSYVNLPFHNSEECIRPLQ